MVILLRIYFYAGWFAEFLDGCDIIVVAVTFAEALMLELAL